MNRNLIFFSIFAILLSCSPKTSWVNKKDIQLTGLEGKWKLKDKETYEKWAKLSDTEYTGVSYNMDAGYATIMESMRIYKKDKNWYFEGKAPEDPEPTTFQWIPDPLWPLKFVNEKHDFPQNICYKINPDNTMFAQISNLDESKKQDYNFIKVLTQ